MSITRCCLLVACCAAAADAQQPATPSPAADFNMTEVMIPTRDGVRLHSKVFVPKNQTGPLPFIMKRTPYGIERAEGNFVAYMKDLVSDGYIFVFQDIRGRHDSEGTFVMQRPLCPEKSKGCVDENTDTYDTIEWLLKNVKPNNTRVGMLGVSYDGWTTAMAGVRPHAALKAISPQASPADMWLGDDFHHNGAFRLSYGFEYAAMMETSKVQDQFAFDRYDTFDWYLALGSLANVNATFLHDKIPTWNDYVAHPDYDEFWQKQTLIPAIRSAGVPTLNVAGWWDQEDFYGPFEIYQAFEKYDTKHHNFLVVGPWNHGGWSGGPGNQLGNIDFGSTTGTYYRAQVQAPFFAYYLKDKGARNFPEALTFESGSNTWRQWDAWPPRNNVATRQLYFHAGGRLSFEAPRTDSPDSADSYVSDPAHPVPYRQRPIQATYFPGGSGWYTWLVQDQRFVDDRADVLSYESAVLDDDVTIAGDIVAQLFAATTGTDADWIVKLIDVFPEQYPQDWKLAGYQLMVANEVFRGRYRNSFEKPAAIPANEVVPYTIGLHTQDYTFRKGHRIMVQVQSSWFPIIDRNPQTFVPNIFLAKPEDFRVATQRIVRNGQQPSRVTVQVVE